MPYTTARILTGTGDIKNFGIYAPNFIAALLSAKSIANRLQLKTNFQVRVVEVH